LAAIWRCTLVFISLMHSKSLRHLGAAAIACGPATAVEGGNGKCAGGGKRRFEHVVKHHDHPRLLSGPILCSCRSLDGSLVRAGYWPDPSGSNGR
jgi:hypothetical protein